MNVKKKREYEIRKWAIEILQAGQPTSREGTAALNREIMNRLEFFLPPEVQGVLARQLGVCGKVRNEPRLKIEQLIVARALAHNPDLSEKKMGEAFKKLAEEHGEGHPPDRRGHASRQTIAKWKKDPSFTKLVAMFQMYEALGFPCQEAKT